MQSRRDFIKTMPATAGAFAVSGTFLTEGSAVAQDAGAAAQPLEGHFHPKGKAPSTFTKEILAQAKETLPFGDERDMREQEKGLVAPMTEMKIMADAGHVAWDMEAFEFLNEDRDFDSIHPSLLRQSRLNQNYGLYKVTDDIYQVRGFDLSDISFVRGKTGWIVIDPLISAEPVRAAWKLFQEHVGEGLPVSAVIYSHSHADHWGGVRGILSEEDLESGKVEIIAPRDFMNYTISENIYAGNAMSRRLFYQYGMNLPVSPHGYVGQGLGQNTSTGVMGLIAPTHVVEDDIEEMTVDGVVMIHQNTPRTEAPSEMNTYFPEHKALWMAENVVASLHNIYTLRGAPVRDPLRWSKYIGEALHKFGVNADIMFASHHWPRWGNERIQEVLRAQRDLYASMNNQCLHYANQGITINQIHNHYELPEGLQQQWHTRGYHGSPEHNARGVVQRYLGFWDCNPTTLIPLSPEDSAPLYVEMMGGAEKIMAKGRELHDAGKYKHATEILDRLVHAEPDNQEARELLADVFEQLGYQQENPGLRNCFLAGALELRSGIPQDPMPDTSGPDVIRAMSTELFLNFLGIKMDSRKAEGMEFTINLLTPDNGEKFILELANATLTNIEGFLADDPDLSLTINRSDLELTMMGVKELEDQIADGTCQAEGDVGILKQLASTMVEFDPRFEILPGTHPGEAASEEVLAYEADPRAPIAE
ncbi:MAG: alkyl sulfatase dimerization domain-containing protein [Verrucomicrobiota bacterium]